MNIRKILMPLKLLVAVVLIPSCEADEKERQQEVVSLEGKWRAELDFGKATMPFEFEIVEEDKQLNAYLINGEERLATGPIQQQNDSLIMQMHVFNNQIRAKRIGDQLKGEWVKGDYEDYSVPFTASKTEAARFKAASEPKADISGRWAAHLYEDSLIVPAVGEFELQGGTMSGTFLTPTGDYRYLAGVVDGEKLKLTAFDGEHAFLFLADIVSADSITNGIFYSGTHWQQPWSAQRNADAALPPADRLTYVKPNTGTFDFIFPAVGGGEISLSDPQFDGKVVVVQLLGSWCPNCMDETAFLAPYYAEHKEKGLEVIGLAFERLKEEDKAMKRLARLKEYFNIEYPLLLANTSDDKLAANEKLPQLNRVVAFPTTIFIDRSGNIRKIHTGFSGPGTGEYYQRLTEEFDQLVQKLLAEEA